MFQIVLHVNWKNKYIYIESFSYIVHADRECIYTGKDNANAYLLLRNSVSYCKLDFWISEFDQLTQLPSERQHWQTGFPWVQIHVEQHQEMAGQIKWQFFF